MIEFEQLTPERQKIILKKAHEALHSWSEKGDINSGWNVLRYAECGFYESYNGISSNELRAWQEENKSRAAYNILEFTKNGLYKVKL